MSGRSRTVPTDHDDRRGDASRAAGGLADEAAEAFDAYRRGDEQRMGELVDLLTPLLWHVARGAGATHQGAQDAVQTTWLKLVDKADTVRDPQAVLGWLITTLRRTVISSARADRDIVLDTTAPEHDRPDDRPDPATVAELDERQQLLWAQVRRLDERCQYLLRVIAFARRPDYSSIADHLDMPIGSIGPTRGRCLNKLRRLLRADARWEGQSHG